MPTEEDTQPIDPDERVVTATPGDPVAASGEPAAAGSGSPDRKAP